MSALRQPVKRRFVKGHYLRGRWIGKNNPNWKGRVKFTKLGYLEIYRENYHHKLTNNSIKLHRFVYEYFHKCCLLSYIEIHHINGIRTDNHKHNLVVLTSSQHAKLNKNRYKFYNKIDMSGRFCLLCRSNKTWVDKKTGWVEWFGYENGLMCRKCYNKTRRKYGKLTSISTRVT